MSHPLPRGYSLIEMMIVMALTVVVAAIAIPMSGNALGFFRVSGDARKVSNAMALAKLTAAASFTQARLYVDLDAKTHHVEIYQKSGTPGWVWSGGSTALSQGVSMGYGSLATPPPNTQVEINQAPECLTDAEVAIANTACVIFNSRGIPVDSAEAPTASGAVYVTDGSAVYGVTISATGMSQVWQSGASSAVWSKQ